MKNNETQKDEKRIALLSQWRHNISLWLNGKFFPRRSFARYWGLMLTVVAVSLASIAHRNMYLLQVNKIKKLEVELIDTRTDRLLLEYERDENMRLHEITEASERNDLPLIHSPEPKKIIEVTTQNKD